MVCLVKGGPLGREGSGGSRSEADLGLTLWLEMVLVFHCVSNVEMMEPGQLLVPSSRAEPKMSLLV